jgi:biotin carboxylase
MKKHLLLLGGRDSSAVKAASFDIDITLFQQPHLMTTNQLNVAKRLFAFDFTNSQEALALAQAIHAYHPFDAVVSFWELGLLPAALIGESLSIPANPVFPVEVTRDKLKMRSLLLQQGIDTVRFRQCETAEDVKEFLVSLGKPVVIKPATGSGSTGVSVVNSVAEIKTAWEWVSATKLDAVIAEEYVDGPEYSVESLTIDGNHQIIAITEKLTTGAPNFVEIGHQMPAPLTEEMQHRIQEFIQQLLDVVRHQAGPAHSEVRISSEGIPKAIETQTRFGGDQIWEMVELVYGVDLVKSTCAHLLGIEYQENLPKAGGAAIRFLAYTNRTVKSIQGLDIARSLPGIVRVECKLKPGDRIGELRNSQARQGYVLAIGDSVTAAIENAERAISEVKFEFADDIYA